MTKANRFLIGGVIGFLLLEIVLIIFVDRPLSEALRTVDDQHHAVIDFFRAWTDLGKSKWSLWPSGIGVIMCAIMIRVKSLSWNIREYAHFAGERLWFLFISVAAAGITTDIIKPILGRARPVELDQEGIYGFHPIAFAARWNSMPSGHATAAFALAFVLAGFFPRFKIPFFILASGLALSRIMVNAHFLSDVIAGGMVAFLTVSTLQSPKGRNGIYHISKVFFPLTINPLKG